MHRFVEKLSNQLENSHCCPEFEIEVVNQEGERDFLLCDIVFRGNSIHAQRDAVSTKEQRSDYIPASRVVCDSSLTLDEHLQALYEVVLDEIVFGGLYTLAS